MDLFKLWGTLGIKTADAFKQLDNVQDKVTNLATDMGKKLTTAGEKISSVGQGARDVGAGMTAGISAPLAAVGIAAGKLAMDVESSTSKISASLGVTKEEAKELSKVSQEVWKDGFGENLEDVNNTLINVRQNMGNLGAGELERVAKHSDMIAKTFDEDINDVTKTASQMMKTYGITSEKAFDLMTVGFQKGGNFSKELLDTLNEYAPQFKQMGYSAEESMAILINGAKNGAWNLDKVGDAVKENFLRLSNMGKAQEDAVTALGFDPATIERQIAEGGESAQTAYAKVMTKLGAVQDKALRNELGTDLFGTQWEDLGSKVVDAMDPAVDVLGKVDGAANTAGKAMQDNFQVKWQKFMRTAQSSLLPVGEILLDIANEWLPKIASAVEKAATAFQGLPGPIQKAAVFGGILLALLGPMIAGFGFMLTGIGGVVTVMGSLVGGFGKVSKAASGLTKVGSGVTKFFGLFKKLTGGALGTIIKFGARLLPLLTNPVGIAIALVLGIIAGAVYLFKNHWDAIKDATERAFNGIGEFLRQWGPKILLALSGPIGWIVALIVKNWDGIKAKTTEAFNAIGTTLRGWGQSISSFFSGLLSSISSAFSNAWNRIRQTISNVTQSIQTALVNGWNAIKAVLSNAMSAIRTAISNGWNAIRSIITTITTAIRTFLTRTWNAIRTAVSNAINGIRSVATRAFNAIRSTASSVASRVRTAFVNAFNAVKNTASKIFGSIGSIISKGFDSVKDLAADAWEWGANIVTGLADGIRGSVKKVVSAAKDLSGNVADAVMEFFDMHSPSRLFRKFGGFLGEGLAIGMDGTHRLLGKAADAMAAAVQPPGDLDFPITPHYEDPTGDFPTIDPDTILPQPDPEGFNFPVPGGGVGGGASVLDANPGGGDKGVTIQHAVFNLKVEKLQTAEDIARMRTAIQNVVADDLFGMAVRNL